MRPAGPRGGQISAVLPYAAILAAASVLLVACQFSPSPAVAPAPDATQTPAAVLAASPATPTTTVAAPVATPTVPASPTASPVPSPTEVEPSSQAAPLIQISASPARPPSNPQGGSADGQAGMRLRIPKLGVEAPIVEVGLLDSGQMGAPENGDEVVWYGGSPLPGSAGNALLAGHVDWKGKGAVFWRLRELRPDDRVVVEAPSGSEMEFTVTRSALYPADEAPIGEIVASGADPVITMITCEGTFDRATRDYSHRRVVQATLSTWLVSHQ